MFQAGQDELDRLEELESKLKADLGTFPVAALSGDSDNSILVGTKKVTIDFEEEATVVIILENAVNPISLDDAKEYFLVSADFEKQLGKFGALENVKILRRADGYSKAGSVSHGLIF